ncbi:hypothetical protein EVAR_5222_1 [Eumeta japonica]|uniref:Uncharacterized protein n=1 Tax=Eumeta variegata TaxID=151549 RepID=A0A4C1V4R4_EUMVA|nr:hypothetical protein EVAR_5222_1 [Eumeta japonica]
MEKAFLNTSIERWKVAKIKRSTSQVAGWGTSVFGFNDVLQIKELPNVDVQRCVAKALDEKTIFVYKTYHITSDKICAGNDTGNQLCMQEKGAGFAVPETDPLDARKSYYYLRGAVSLYDILRRLSEIEAQDTNRCVCLSLSLSLSRSVSLALRRANCARVEGTRAFHFLCLSLSLLGGLTMPEWKGRVPLTRSHCERITHWPDLMLKYCRHLFAGVHQYLPLPLHYIPSRESPIAGKPLLSYRVDTLALRRDIQFLCKLYRMHYEMLLA